MDIHVEVGVESHQDCSGIENGLNSINTSMLVLSHACIQQGDSSVNWETFLS